MNNFYCTSLLLLFLCCVGAKSDDDVLTHLNALHSATLKQESLKSTFEKLSMKQDDVTLVYFNKANPDIGISINYENVPNLEKLTSYDRSLKSFIFVHGWLSSCNESNNAIRTALMTYHNVNYFELCWERYAYTEYLISRSSISNVAKYFARYLSAMVDNFNLDLASLTIVGHSLGAHIAGVTSENLNSSVGTVVGLDAAGPFVFKFEKDRLTPDSAIYVQVIHTDCQFLGVNYDIGNADFWPNGGWTQNGCLLDIVGICAHKRAIAYYAESLSNGKFLGRLCKNYTEYSKGNCNVNLEKPLGGYPLDPSVIGNFFLYTNPSPPYALGPEDP